MRTYGRLVVSRTRLVELLAQHRGEASAITGDDLAVILRVKEEDNRSLREALDELVLDGYPIGSTSGKHAGYYWITTEQELKKATGTLRSRIREHEKKIAALESGFRAGARQPALI